MRQELTSHPVLPGPPGRQGGGEEGDPLRWMGEGHRGAWEASGHGPQRGLRRRGGEGHNGCCVWTLGPRPPINACHSVAAGHLSDCAAGGKGSGRQGGRGRDRAGAGSWPLSGPWHCWPGLVSSAHQFSATHRGRATSPAPGAELGPGGPVLRRPSGPRPRGCCQGGGRPRGARVLASSEAGHLVLTGTFAAITWAAGPRLHHHVPRTVHVTRR